MFSFLLMPSGILFCFLTFAYIKSQKSRKIIAISIVLFYCFTNPILVNYLLLWWEYPTQKLENLPKTEVGIILTGGIINDEKEPASNVYLGKSADRMAQALLLYKNQKIKKILISGGSNNIFSTSITDEGRQIAKFLMLCGVPAKDIFLEHYSRNTHQNAINCSKFLAKHYPQQKYTLISSTIHLPRAIACFKKQKLEVVPYGSNYYSHKPAFLINYLFPHEEYLYYSESVFHEIFGFAIYKILEYC